MRGGFGRPFLFQGGSGDGLGGLLLRLWLRVCLCGYSGVFGMRALRLVLWFFVGLFLGGYGVYASAAVTSWTASGFTGSSAGAACSAWYAAQSTYQQNQNYSMDGPIELVDMGTYYRGTCALKYNGTLVASRPTVQSVGKCDAPLVLTADGSCGCPSGQELLNGQCVPQCAPSQQRNEQGQCYCQQATFQPSFSATLPAGYVIGGTMCNNGCETKSSGGVVPGGFMIGGSWTGVMCSGNPPAKCPLGQAIGYLNDVPFCAPTSSGQQTTTQNGDGSTTTKTVQTDSKGNTVVTTRTVGPDGSVQVQTQVFPGNQTGQGSGTGTGDPSGTGTQIGSGDAATGTGTTGANSGSGSGGDGTCTGVDCGSGGGTFSGPSDDLYQAKDRTLTQAANDFVASAQQAPVVQSVGGFFSVPTFSGACPDFGGAIPFFGESVSLSAGSDWCSWPAWDWVGAALMVLAAWVAFRWGFL